MRKWLVAGACLLSLGAGGYAAAVSHNKPHPKTPADPLAGTHTCYYTGGSSGVIPAC